MISLTMDQAQFECVKKFASSDDAMLKAHDFKLSNMSEDGNSGHIHTKEIDADFEFREVALVLDNEKKHGLYGFASDDTIGTHLQQILGDLKCEDVIGVAAQDPNLIPSTTAETTVANTLSDFVKPTQTS